MDKLGDLIKGRLDKHNLSSSAKSAEVIYKANLLIADKFDTSKNNVKAYRLDGGILFIATESATLSQEVWGVQGSILADLSKSFGKNVIKKIRIKTTD